MMSEQIEKGEGAVSESKAMPEWTAAICHTVAEAREESGFKWLTDKELEARLPVGCVWQVCPGGGTTGLPGHVETTAANAHLMAAAPDLYAALLAMLDYSNARTNPAHKIAEAALVKARGEA